MTQRNKKSWPGGHGKRRASASCRENPSIMSIIASSDFTRSLLEVPPQLPSNNTAISKRSLLQQTLPLSDLEKVTNHGSHALTWPFGLLLWCEKDSEPSA